MILKRIVIPFFISFICFFSAYSEISQEFAVKAAYLEKIAKYIEWPKYSDNFVIAVIGNTPIYDALEMISSKLFIKNKKVIVKAVDDISNYDNCNLLYIPRSQRSNYKRIFEKIKYTPCLIFGEDEAISRYGVHINFYLKNDNTLHFEIYPENLKQSSLKPDLYLIDIGKRR